MAKISLVTAMESSAQAVQHDLERSHISSQSTEDLRTVRDPGPSTHETQLLPDVVETSDIPHVETSIPPSSPAILLSGSASVHIRGIASTKIVEQSIISTRLSISLPPDAKPSPAKIPRQSTCRAHRHATAADIPPELYDLILYFLEHSETMNGYAGEQAQRNRIEASSRELSQLGLVCFSWARMCQNKLYQIIQLQSLDELQELISFTYHPCSRISRYVEHLQLIANPQCRPWIHKVCRTVHVLSTSPGRPGSPFPLYEGHILVLRSETGLEVLKRGLHAALPRRVPSIFSQGIALLVLRDMTLPGVEDVVRVSRELPSLKTLGLRRVRWTTAPSTEAETYAPLVRRRPWKKHAPVRRVETFKYEEAWIGLPLLCLLDTSRPLCAVDVAAVAKLAQTLAASVEKTGQQQPMMRAKRKDWGYRLTMRATADRLLAPILHVGIVQAPEQGYWQVDVIALDFVPAVNTTMRTLSAMTEYDWLQFDELAASFPSLRHVVVGFKNRSDLALFAKKIEPKLWQLQASQRLKYALYYENNDLVPDCGWVACEPADAREEPAHARRVKTEDLVRLYS